MFENLSFADFLFILLVGGVIYGFVSISSLGRKKKQSGEDDS